MLKQFRQSLINEGKSEHTVKGYTHDLELYFRWKDSDKPLTRQDVLDYKDYLKTELRNNAKTINHKLSSLKKYNEFLMANGYCDSMYVLKSDMMAIQVQYASPTNVTADEVKIFINTLKKKEPYRNYTIAYLIAYTGLRIDEALSILLDDIDLDNGEIMIQSGKGEKQRTVYINSKVKEVLKKYMDNDRASYKESPYLFSSKKAIRIQCPTINAIFNKYSDKITPHSLRHWFCTNALEKGMSIHEVANQAGHSNIQTTLLYTNPTKSVMKNKMERL